MPEARSARQAQLPSDQEEGCFVANKVMATVDAGPEEAEDTAAAAVIEAVAEAAATA